MVKNIFYLFLFLLQTTVYSQPGSVYSDLEVVKFYNIDLRASGTNKNKTYSLNGKSISRSVYNKYMRYWDDFDSCCPCLLQTYDEHDVLLYEAVACTDCRVGAFKAFYSTGNVKEIGQYKENDTEDWSNISKRGYCYVKDGTWQYYTEDGKLYLTETWIDGEFIEQRPESGKVEIWKVDLLLNGRNINNQRITIEEFNELEVIPQYKNSKKSSRIRLKVSISSPGFTVNREFYLEDLKKMNLKGAVDELETSNIENIRLGIIVFDRNECVGYLNLKLKK